MKHKHFNRLLSMLLVVATLFGLLGPAQELERSGVGAAGRLQFPAVLGKGAGHARRLALFVGQQGTQVVVQVLHLFAVRVQLRRFCDDGLDDRSPAGTPHHPDHPMEPGGLLPGRQPGRVHRHL